MIQGNLKMDRESNVQKRPLESKKWEFTYTDILKITNNFERILGKGGFGKVHHGYIDGSQVAVKMLSQLSVQGYEQFQVEVISNIDEMTQKKIEIIHVRACLVSPIVICWLI